MEIPLFKVFMSPTVVQPLIQTLLSGYITQGEKVEQFEKSLREYFKWPWVLTLNSATSGLTLALRLLNLNETDEILTVPLTCTATNWPILANNSKIKWVDIDRDTCNINLLDLERKITKNTRVIQFVHWGGVPVNLIKVDNIIKKAEKLFDIKINVIEDCAHAFGADYQGRKIGTHGNIAVFSLQAIKHLTCVDGGIIILPNEEMYKRAKLMRWFGINREQRSKGDFRLESDISEWGYKFHMNDVNATIGLGNLPFVDQNIQKMRENATYYKTVLKEIGGVILFEEPDNCLSSYWLFSLKICNKKDFIEFAKKKGVTVSQVHNRNDVHSCVKEFKVLLPELDELEKELICIPVGWWVGEKEREYIVSIIKEWTNSCMYF